MLKTTAGLTMAIALAAMTTAASAQSFTFKAKRGDITQLGGIGTNGSLYTGGHWKGTYAATFDGEDVVTGTYECAATNQPPGIFHMHAACTMTQPDGTFTSAWGCNPYDQKGMEMGCVAGLHGRSGRFEGLVGVASSHLKGADSDGSGQFYKVGE